MISQLFPSFDMKYGGKYGVLYPDSTPLGTRKNTSSPDFERENMKNTLSSDFPWRKVPSAFADPTFKKGEREKKKKKK